MFLFDAHFTPEQFDGDMLMLTSHGVRTELGEWYSFHVVKCINNRDETFIQHLTNESRKKTITSRENISFGEKNKTIKTINFEFQHLSPETKSDYSA